MTANLDLVFQVELFSRITAAMAALTPVPTVTSHPIPGQLLPFVRIGETYVQDHVAGHDIQVDILSFSSVEGPHQVKEIMHAIREALHASQRIVTTDWTFVAIRETDARTVFDVDEEVWQGIQTFRLIASTNTEG